MGIIVAAVGHAWWRLTDAFWYHHDDLLQFSVAQEFGVAWETFSLNVFGHFAPFNRLVHLVLVQGAEADLGAAVAVVMTLVTGFLFSVAWLCAELRLPTWRQALVLVFAGFSVATLDVAVWLDGAVHILSALTVTYVVVAAHLRGLRTGRWSWHVLSVLAFALGFATQERVAFALPLIVLFDVLLVGAARPWRQRFALLWSARWPLLSMVVISAMVAFFLLTEYSQESVADPTLGQVGQVLAGAGTTVLVPMLVGVVPAVLPSATVQTAAGVAIAVAVTLLLLRNRSNAGPLVVILATLTMYYGFLIFSPILVPESLEDNALRLGNAIYLLVPTLVSLASLDLRRRGTGRHPVQASSGPRVVRYGPAALVVLSVVVLVITAALFTDRQWTMARKAHAYLENVQAGKAEWSDPDITLLPLRVPADIANGWAEDYGRQAHFLKYYDSDWAPSPLGDRPMVLDQTGRLRDVVLQEVTPAGLPFADGAPGCLTSEQGRGFLGFELPREAEGAPLFARVDYRLSVPEGDGTFVIFSGRPAQGGDVPSWQTWLPSGEHSVVVPLHPRSVSAFFVGSIPVGATLCVSGASILRPAYEEDGICQLVDEFGAAGRVTNCPTLRPS